MKGKDGNTDVPSFSIWDMVYSLNVLSLHKIQTGCRFLNFVMDDFHKGSSRRVWCIYLSMQKQKRPWLESGPAFYSKPQRAAAM